MIQREIAKTLKKLFSAFPVVTIQGSRQSGKTTLAKMVFPRHAYANLEDAATRRLAESDPVAFFEQFKPPAIIDEIQIVPELLGAIQVEVDRRGGNGLFVLTGSHQPRLREGRRTACRQVGHLFGRRVADCGRWQICQLPKRRFADRRYEVLSQRRRSDGLGCADKRL